MVTHSYTLKFRQLEFVVVVKAKQTKINVGEGTCVYKLMEQADGFKPLRFSRNAYNLWISCSIKEPHFFWGGVIKYGE